MFMFCYFYDDDNDDLPNVLTLKKKKKSVYQGLEGLECWQVVRNAIFWAFSVFDASSAAALLNSYSGNKQKKTLASIPLSSPDWRCSRCYMLSAVE